MDFLNNNLSSQDFSNGSFFVVQNPTQAQPQYKIIQNSGCDLPLKIFEHTHLEIGFGNGEYTVNYAKAHPEIFLYGLELSQACILRCARRAKGLNNLKIIRADARYMLREFFDDETLEKIIMNFPCPWSKNKNAHRRVTAKDFADGLASVLKVGGIFEFVSDDLNYSNEVRDIIGNHEAIKLLNFEVNPIRPVTTKYERKWLAEGKNIHRITFEKIKAFSCGRRVENQIMHIKLNNQVNKNNIADLNNISGNQNKAFWKFGDYFINSDGVFLLEAFTSDDGFDQKFYVNISNRDENKSLVRLDNTANAFLTPAVRFALNDVAARLSVN